MERERDENETMRRSAGALDIGLELITQAMGETSGNEVLMHSAEIGFLYKRAQNLKTARRCQWRTSRIGTGLIHKGSWDRRTVPDRPSCWETRKCRSKVRVAGVAEIWREVSENAGFRVRSRLTAEPG